MTHADWSRIGDERGDVASPGRLTPFEPPSPRFERITRMATHCSTPQRRPSWPAASTATAGLAVPRWQSARIGSLLQCGKWSAPLVARLSSAVEGR